MNKPKTPPCIGHDQETEILEDIDTIMDAAISKLLEPPASSLILYNDDVNSFDHVISCLIKYCNKKSLEAEQMALTVHLNGKCVVYSGTIEKLTPICNALLSQGLNVEIK